MRKKTLISALALSLLFSGCIFEVQGPDEPYVAPAQPIVIETKEPDATPEPEIEPTDEPEVQPTDKPDDIDPVIDEPTDDPQPVSTTGREWNFVKGKGDIPEDIQDKGNYEEEYDWYQFSIDMDKDGLDEQFVIVELNEPGFADIAGELWFVDGEGYTQIIGTEDYLEYFSNVSVYDYGAQVHVAIGWTYGIGGEGYLFSYTNGKLEDRSDEFMSRGYKSFTEDGEVEFILESYTGYLDIDPTFGEMWTGHTWVPYYYTFDGSKYNLVQPEEIGLEGAEEMATFDDSAIRSEDEPYEYILVGDDRLMVNAKKTDDGDGRESYSYYIYKYKLDSDAGEWVFDERISGIYITE